MPVVIKAALALLLGVTSALAEAPLMSEREALDAGKKALREQRFDDAIAAFAQSDKEWPAGDARDNTLDPRSTAIVETLHEILADLGKRGATPQEKLPYWRFYVDNFPFFNTSIYYPIHYEDLTPDSLLQVTAEEECREDDPKGTSERAQLCERVRKECEAKDAEGLLATLEKEWPAAHADHDLCAIRAWHVLEAWCGPKTQDGPTPRSRRASAAWFGRFRAARCLPQAANAFGESGEGPSPAWDVHARRWWILEVGQMAFDPPSKFAESLPECSGPWVSEAIAATWAMSLYVSNPDLEGPLPEQAEGARRLEEMKKAFPGTRELGLAKYTFLWKSVATEWELYQPWIQRYLDAWEKEAPEDPYLPWARYQAIAHRAREPQGLPIAGSDRRMLESFAERFRGDALGVHALSLLADDAAACGEGDLALKRYQEVASFDPLAARLPAAENADGAVGWARARLVEYYEHHDVSKLPDLLPQGAGRWGSFQEESFCGNALAAADRDQLRAKFRLWKLAGHPEPAIERYENRIFNGLADLAPGLEVDYAEAGLQTGNMDRLQKTLKVLDGLPPDALQVPTAKSLHEYLDDRDTLQREGPGAAPRLLTQALGEKPDLQYFFRRRTRLSRALGILDVLRTLRGVDGALEDTHDSPPTPLSVLLASCGDSEESLSYLERAAQDRQPEVQSDLTTGALASRGETAARFLLLHAGEWLADGEERLDVLLEAFDSTELWKACTSLAEDAPEPARRHARWQIQRIRRKDPWLAYCLEGK